MARFIIRGGTVYDGTGAPPKRADILIEDDRISAMGSNLSMENVEKIDAEGYAVVPGFVDIHRHHDLAIFRDADFGKIELAQGITSIIGGNCGLAPVPLDPQKDAEFFSYLEPVTGKFPDDSLLKTRNYEEYSAALEKLHLPLNTGFLAGMGAVRYAVKGFNANPYTAKEQQQATELIGQAMDAGAYGISLGIMYRPECYTASHEYDALIKPVAERNGILCTHIRGEGNSLVESVQEVIQLAERTGVRLNISHFKATGIHNWQKKIFEAIDCIEAARAKGQIVTADFYPYDGGSTTLLSLLPPTLIEKQPAYFESAVGREELRREIYREHPGWDNMVLSIGWHRILLSSVENADFVQDQGKPFDEIAAHHGYSEPADLMAELLATEGGNVGIVVLSMDWKDVQTVAKLPYTALISDSLYAGGNSPHPRLYGAFPRMLRLMALEKRLMPYEQAISKMTALPAARMEIRDRGVLQPGKKADVLVFDPYQFKDIANYGDPKQQAIGLHLAFVNGQIVWKNEAIPGASAGQILRKN